MALKKEKENPDIFPPSPPPPLQGSFSRSVGQWQHAHENQTHFNNMTQNMPVHP